jgi:hypothetical protein
MERADVYAVMPAQQKPVAVLILCPGRNHNGEEWIRMKPWQDFAKGHQLGLVGISFASPEALMDQSKGYPRAAQGSGKIILDAVHQIYGADLPLLFYGCSAGGVFTYQFADWKPEKIIAWSAWAGDFDEQARHDNAPPGIIACGENDGAHYGAALSYFKKGRALGKPWLWISIGKWDHVRSPELEEFVRQYFDAVLKEHTDPCWVDIDLKKEISKAKAVQMPSESGWLPDQELLAPWAKIHEP